MRLDPQTGALIVRPGLTITADTTAAELSRHGATHEGYSNGWTWEKLEEPASGPRWSVAVSFDPDGHLSIILLSTMTADEPRSWDFWTEEGELARREDHTRWLEEQLGDTWRQAPVERWHGNEQRELSWGIVSSGYDSRSGGSSIAVRYQ